MSNKYRVGFKLMRLLVATALLLGACVDAVAHDQIPAPPQSRPIVIRGATLHRVDGPTMDAADLLFIDGKITAIGREIQLPPKTQVIDGQGQHVYPGLFESSTDLGLREINAVGESVDSDEFGDLNPNARSWVAFNPDSELIPVARAGGVLLANVSPRGRWINGQTAVMQLDGWSAREMTLTAPSGLSLTWRHMMPRDDDAKKQAKQREQKIIEFDELLDRVRRYEASREQSPETTATDLRLESLLPVVRGELPLIVQANLQAEIESAIAYTQRQGLKLILFGGYDAVKSKELLTEYDIPVLVAGTYRRPIRRDDAYDDAYTLPARLRKAGIRFAIGGHGAGSPQGSSNARNLPYHAAAAVAFGLSVDDAIRSITLSPAEIFGVADRVGSLTVGKDATIIVSDGDILQTESNVVRAFIQGRDVDLSSRHTMLFEKYRRKVAAGRSQ